MREIRVRVRVRVGVLSWQSLVVQERDESTSEGIERIEKGGGRIRERIFILLNSEGRERDTGGEREIHTSLSL